MRNGRQPPAVVVPPGRISTLPPKSVGKWSAAVCGAPAAAIGASGTLRSFHHGLAFGGAAAGPSDTVSGMVPRCAQATPQRFSLLLVLRFLAEIMDESLRPTTLLKLFQ